ncbi:hypothetical protein C8A05DRAFT_15981 [Staphylotrichum tortipilum]|uniref:Uncharacterized protein n=1 Tax=Staphylotrichum tortipilum TaxID=2831512 RepID=A0AAN6RTG6_9PEZI|nr:hypothetical protein C8A05DRAFT_15981 [Staphylotrichum longicolle]
MRRHLSTQARHRRLVLAVAALLLFLRLPTCSLVTALSRSVTQWADEHDAFLAQSVFRRRGWRVRASQASSSQQEPLDIWEADLFAWGSRDAVPKQKFYKPASGKSRPVPDPFPLLSRNPPPRGAVLRAPRGNRPPKRHVKEKTVLFVGFTRNWPQLLQCVVSYIAAGWPAEDIWVVENTGVMDANRRGRLSLQNPFYLNHTQLGMLGVNVIMTPTLLTFSQLQNFYLHTALSTHHPYFFWTHQDLLVFTFENDTSPIHPHQPPPSLYANAVATLRHLTARSASGNTTKWAHHFFAYDHLTLVNRDAVLSVGGWDTHIPFYASDCDTYVRLMWAGFAQGESEIGIIFDVGSVMTDLGALLRIRGAKARVDLGLDDDDGEDNKVDKGYVETWTGLVETAARMEEAKYAHGNAWRNTWQVKQRGGQGEPFYRDADGFEKGVKMWIDAGRSVFAEKWGHRGCDVANVGIKGEDAWRLERDWDEETEGLGFQGSSW